MKLRLQIRQENLAALRAERPLVGGDGVGMCQRLGDTIDLDAVSGKSDKLLGVSEQWHITLLHMVSKNGTPTIFCAKKKKYMKGRRQSDITFLND